jgi:multiple sugar transport system ATP-binding protein
MAANPGTTSVSVRDLLLAYGELVVLQTLNLDINKGEFLVLLGPSGCGKSTLLNCIAGLLEPTKGQIFINGKNVTWEEPKDRGIGMVFQSYALYPQMTVEGNLSFGLKNAKMAKEEIAKRIARAAEILQIEPLLKRKPSQLSGGQRTADGNALVRDVEVFLFDEPLSNLDAKLRSELRVEIKRLHQKLGNTMIYVTHDQIEALTLADRIAVMKSGVVQQLAGPDEIYNRPKNLYVAGFIGSPSMNFLKATVLKSGNAAAAKVGSSSVPLADYKAEREMADGQKIIFGVRPEHIRLNAPEAVGFSPEFNAAVELVEPMGSDSLVWLDFEGQSMTARVESSAVFHPGDKVKVRFRAGLASLFDEADSNRI